MKCPHCNLEHDGDFLYCPTTGGQLWQSCKNMNCKAFSQGIRLPLNYMVCPYCGEKLDYVDGHIAVDLGLSVRWAKCNIGARNPEDFGDYFAWGETDPYYQSYDGRTPSSIRWKEGKESGYCDWQNYFDYVPDGDSFDIQKYYLKGGKEILDPLDDAAHKNWGDNWRIPTKEEFLELLEMCNRSIDKNEKGVTFYSKINRNSIFLPYAGYFSGSGYILDYYGGAYWTSVLGKGSFEATCFDFSRADIVSVSRMIGASIRPVCSL